MHSVPAGIATVTQTGDGKRYLVDLSSKTCTCRRFQDILIPCGHAMTVIHRIGGTPNNYIPDIAKKEMWAAAYQDNFPSIDLEEVEMVHVRGRMLGNTSDLESGSDSDSSVLSEPPLDGCEPPLTRMPKGRPSKKRKRTGDVRRARKTQRRRIDIPDIPDKAPHRCSTCKGLGHNAADCNRPHC